MSLLDDVILDDRRRPPQMQGPQPGRVLGPSGSKLLVSLEAFPEQEFACTWGRGEEHTHPLSPGSTGYSGPGDPPAGTRCLVLFAGQGVADPWVVAFASWPE